MPDQEPEQETPNPNPDSVPASPIEKEIEETAEAQAIDAELDVSVDLKLYQEEVNALEQQISLGVSKSEYERRQRHQWLKESVDLHGLRQTYTGYLFKLTCIWLAAVLLFVFMTGFHGPIPLYRAYIYLNENQCDEPCIKWFFSLSDKVLIAFITSTTASVIGIFIIVAKWLFPSDYTPDKPRRRWTDWVGKKE